MLYINHIRKYIWYTRDGSSMDAATVTVITGVVIINGICFFVQNWEGNFSKTNK